MGWKLPEVAESKACADDKSGYEGRVPFMRSGDEWHLVKAGTVAPRGPAGGVEIIGNGSEVRGRPQPDRSERRSLPTQASDEIGLH